SLCPCGKNFCLMTRGLKMEQLSNKKMNPKQLLCLKYIKQKYSSKILIVNKLKIYIFQTTLNE
ncbi:MAG: hypothetical protein ACOVQA_05515, partial [Thermoflexibacteraceae bacterium]